LYFFTFVLFTKRKFLLNKIKFKFLRMKCVCYFNQTATESFLRLTNKITLLGFQKITSITTIDIFSWLSLSFFVVFSLALFRYVFNHAHLHQNSGDGQLSSQFQIKYDKAMLGKQTKLRHLFRNIKIQEVSSGLIFTYFRRN